MAIFACTLLFAQDIRYINTENLNIRSGPGKNHPVVDTAPLRNSVTVISQSGNWTQIETQDGAKGYASSKFLSDNAISTVNPKKEATPTWQLIALVIAFLLSYRFFGGKKSSSSSSRTISESSTKSVSKKLSAPSTKKYFCKFCGSEHTSVKSLTFSSCRNSPNGKHQPFEGEPMKKYFCKFCGSEHSSIKSLTFSSCRNSPNRKHQPFEGEPMKKYFCKFCGSEHSSIKSLTFSSCRNSPNGKHQPSI